MFVVWEVVVGCPLILKQLDRRPLAILLFILASRWCCLWPDRSMFRIPAGGLIGLVDCQMWGYTFAMTVSMQKPPTAIVVVPKRRGRELVCLPAWICYFRDGVRWFSEGSGLHSC